MARRRREPRRREPRGATAGAAAPEGYDGPEYARRGGGASPPARGIAGSVARKAATAAMRAAAACSSADGGAVARPAASYTPPDHAARFGRESVPVAVTAAGAAPALAHIGVRPYASPEKHALRAFKHSRRGSRRPAGALGGRRGTTNALATAAVHKSTRATLIVRFGGQRPVPLDLVRTRRA